jgi:hypothetical protein
LSKKQKLQEEPSAQTRLLAIDDGNGADKSYFFGYFASA